MLPILLLLLVAGSADAQRAQRISGDRLSGFVLPIEPVSGAIGLEALRGWAWTVDDTKRLVLEGDVSVTIGDHRMRAATAVVWVNRIPSADGVINQIAVYYGQASNPARQAGIGAEGRDLLVTGSARGSVRLSVSRLEQRQPRLRPLVQRGEARLARHLRELLADGATLEQLPQVDAPAPRREDALVPGGVPEPPEPELPETIELPDPEPTTLPLLAPRGIVRWSAGTIEHSSGTEENIVTATGGLIVEYVAAVREQDWSQITLSAQRGVIFTKASAAGDPVQLDAEDIHGIYLEGNVRIAADDGDYVARAPRVYYDFRTQEAVMVDAVLRTYSRESNVPIYARAAELRQVAANQWQAREVLVSTSEFHTPHLAIGASRMTMTRRPARADVERRESYIVSEGNRLHLGDLTLLTWPRFSGTIQDLPLQRVTMGTRENDGVRIETQWDLHALLGLDTPDDVDARLLLDGFSKRGGAVGLIYDEDDGESRTYLELYGLYDEGVDRTTTGREIDHDGDFRGLALIEHEARLTRDWSMQAQLALISDETFIDAWREDDFIHRREYESSVYLKQQSGGGANTLLAQYALNDFISNSYLLASRQFAVDKLPEITFRRYGWNLFGDALVYGGETRVTRMRFMIENHTPRQLGVPGAAFGVGEDDNLRDVLRQQGFPQHYVSRFDTRHELMMPIDAGPVRIVPFGVARLTAYDEDFEEFSSQADSTRVFGALGLRLNTQLHHVDNSVSNAALDLNRMRHIIEPSATIWWASSDVSQEHLPAYDPEVESLLTGGNVRLGVRSTWQTQRGGPGRWRSVDYVTLDTNIAWSSDDANRESPASRFFDYRPEYGQAGDHVHTTLSWLISDSVSVVGENIWDLDNDMTARTSIGAELRHNPIFSTFVEYRLIDASENELLDVGWNYRLTPVYRINIGPQWDFEENEFRSVNLRVTRRFPDFDFSVRVKHDEISNDTTIGASMDLVSF